MTTRQEPAPPQAPRDPLPMCPLAAPATWTCPRPPRGLLPGGDQARASAEAIDRHRGPRPPPAGARPLRAVAGAPEATGKSPRRAAKTRSSTTSTRVGSGTRCAVTGTTARHRVPQFRTAPISTLASAACTCATAACPRDTAPSNVESRTRSSGLLQAPSAAGQRHRAPGAGRRACPQTHERDHVQLHQGPVPSARWRGLPKPLESHQGAQRRPDLQLPPPGWGVARAVP